MRYPSSEKLQIIGLAQNEPELSPRELAVTFTDTKGYFVSEPSVYRLLKAHELITSLAFIVIKVADGFHDKMTAPNQLWHQTLKNPILPENYFLPGDPERQTAVFVEHDNHRR